MSTVLEWESTIRICFHVVLMLQDLATRLKEEHMRNEALLFALKQQRDTGTVSSVSRGASIGTAAQKRPHVLGGDATSSAGGPASSRSTADVGIQMVHSQVFALDAIIQCKIAEDERTQNCTICSICGGTAEEALEGELTLALGLADQRIPPRIYLQEAAKSACGLSEGDCEVACMQLSEMRGELKQVHQSLQTSMGKLSPTHDAHASELQQVASELLHATETSLQDSPRGAVAARAADDSGACFCWHSNAIVVLLKSAYVKTRAS